MSNSDAQLSGHQTLWHLLPEPIVCKLYGSVDAHLDDGDGRTRSSTGQRTVLCRPFVFGSYADATRNSDPRGSLRSSGIFTPSTSEQRASRVAELRGTGR
ncbi:hypothetical protein COOONC_22746 [Cooperia oncophora]